MARESFLNDRVHLYSGDCRDVLAALDENSIDSCCCDPPYHLVSIVKRFGSPNAKPVRVGDINATSDLKAAHARAAAGFMGKAWDGGDIAFDPDTWRAVIRVLKPGAHAAVFAIPKHVGLVQVAMMEAGFEFREMVAWVFGSGFPKSHDVSKAIDRAAGAEREIIRERYTAKRIKPGATVVREGAYGKQDITFTAVDSAPATDAARQWEGWGSALKPAMELVILARKPLSEKSIAANVLKWGTGAINIDSCRVSLSHVIGQRPWENGPATAGRWPSNVIHDGSDEVVAAFPDSAGGYRGAGERTNGYGMAADPEKKPIGFGDSGSAARFFYSSKADADDRIGSKHPTVKPVDLMQYLVRLITPPRGLCLDPFAGTGTTGEAAWREGMCAVLIEREEEYRIDIRRRMELALAGPDERARQSIKASGKIESPGPLFDWLEP